MPLADVNPSRYDTLLKAKVERVCSMLKPYTDLEPMVVPSAATGFRMRAEFRMWHDGDALDYVMFAPEAPREPIAIAAFPIADIAIQRLMVPLRDSLKNNPLLRRKLFQVEFLATLSGHMLVTLIYHRALDDDWETAAQALIEELADVAPNLSIIGRSRKQKRILGLDHVIERLTVHGTPYSYVQFEQSFTQPNARVNEKMIEWACNASKPRAGDLLELYCGNGNFTLPLATHYDSVIATELAKSSTRAAKTNLIDNGVENVAVIRLSAEEVVQAMQGEREFRRLRDLPKPLSDYALNTLFVDPPRAGLDTTTTAMATEFETVLYVSCNPHTLADNLQTLCQHHQVTQFALFDQFPYTDHMECGVVLQKQT